MIKFDSFRSKPDLIKHIRETTQYKTAAQAEKFLREYLPKESYFQKKCMDAIRAAAPSAFIWKAAAGPYGRAGIPDICAVIGGRFYGFEVKRPFIGQLTAIQEQTIARIRAAGGIVHVVSWPEDVEKAIKEGQNGEAENQ